MIDPRGSWHFYLRDPNGNIFEIIEQASSWFKNEKKHTGGTYGVSIGCKDLEQSISFYKNILGYDQVLYKGEDIFADLQGLPLKEGEYKRAILTHSESRTGAFSQMFGQSEIELFEAQNKEKNRIFEDRFWGDLGFIHLCFDIAGMDSLRKQCKTKGSPFTVDSSTAQDGTSFDMGEASGFFSYIEDPNGTLIEFVETHKVPIVKKLGLNLNLKRRKASKPLPKWMLKAFSYNRVKN